MNTIAEEARVDHHEHGHDADKHCRTVEIHVNNKPVFLHAGKYDLSTFKKLAGIPQADDVDELIDCKLKPTHDNAPIHIEGCEVFISHIKDGGAS